MPNKKQTEPFTFSLKKAVIITQSDYSLTRIVNHQEAWKCTDLDDSIEDTKLAAWVARSFGVASEDITFIEDWTLQKIKPVFESIKK